MNRQDETVSPVSSKAPEFIVSSAAINYTPIELEASPATQQQSRTPSSMQKTEDYQRRQVLISERKRDPAVLVDIDSEIPRADELAISGAAVSNDDAVGGC